MEKWRILVVDDEMDIRDLVRSSLEPNYDVLEARDGLDALEKIDRAEPDLVVLDVMMPLMDGIQTCQKIRQNDKFRDMTVLFLSALGSKDEIQRGYTAGANLYLTKPFDPMRLKRNIDLFFEKKTEHGPPHRRFTLPELHSLEHGGPQAIAGQTAPGLPPAQSIPGADNPRPRILVVDDEPGICSLATRALHHYYDVFCAADGIDAIGKITSYQPDLILIDTLMPRMSGYQLCQSLRANARYTHTPIILASAKHSQKDREYSLRIGGDYFLQKPYTDVEVLHACEEMVRRPGFTVYPKALTAIQVQEIEGFRVDQLDKHHTHGQNHVGETSSYSGQDMESFLRNLERR